MSDLNGREAAQDEVVAAIQSEEQQLETAPVVTAGESAPESGTTDAAPILAETSWAQTEDSPAMPANEIKEIKERTATTVAPIVKTTVPGMGGAPDRENELIEQQMHRMSRRSFLWGAVAVAAGYGGFRWLTGQPMDDGILSPLRRVLQFNEGLARGYYRNSRLAPTFERARAETPRSNGDIGLLSDMDPAEWKLYVIGLADTSRARRVSLPIPKVVDSDDNTPLPVKEELAVALDMAAIRALPRVEMVTELKCIEGWSTIVHWAGAKFSDFVAHYAPQLENGQLPQYVGLQTPDGRYFVGMDMESAMHPQTLLCYEMNGEPLKDDHGAPLRLVTPVKYGIKHIKRIGAIRFTNERPIDYWAVLGYDWYAGH